MAALVRSNTAEQIIFLRQATEKYTYSRYGDASAVRIKIEDEYVTAYN